MRAIGLAAFLFVALCVGAPPLVRSAPPSEAVVLTDTAIHRVDLTGSRIVRSRAFPTGDGWKVVHAGRFVYVMRRRAVEIFDDQRLQRVATAPLAADAHALASAFPLLFVAVGSELHIMRIAAGGRPSLVSSVRLPKPADGLAAGEAAVYVIDDIVAPFYIHHIDVRRPEKPVVSTLEWMGVNTHLTAQALADRWYILSTYGVLSGAGQHLRAVSLRPPLWFLEEWELVSVERDRTSGIRGPFLQDFRIFRGVLHGVVHDDERLWLVRRPLRKGAVYERATDLGKPPPVPRVGILDLVESRLYLAAASALLAFDLSADRPPVQVMRVPVSGPIRSFALRIPTP